jgi:hypothetical protein
VAVVVSRVVGDGSLALVGGGLNVALCGARGGEW